MNRLSFSKKAKGLGSSLNRDMFYVDQEVVYVRLGVRVYGGWSGIGRESRVPSCPNSIVMFLLIGPEQWSPVKH
eukprot:4739656-Pyramimonas_sp.AAC.1